jgi:hypothetical protein
MIKNTSVSFNKKGIISIKTNYHESIPVVSDFFFKKYMEYNSDVEEGILGESFYQYLINNNVDMSSIKFNLSSKNGKPENTIRLINNGISIGFMKKTQERLTSRYDGNVRHLSNGFFCYIGSKETIKKNASDIWNNSFFSSYTYGNDFLEKFEKLGYNLNFLHFSCKLNKDL